MKFPEFAKDIGKWATSVCEEAMSHDAVWSPRFTPLSASLDVYCVYLDAGPPVHSGRVPGSSWNTEHGCKPGAGRSSVELFNDAFEPKLCRLT